MDEAGNKNHSLFRWQNLFIAVLVFAFVLALWSLIAAVHYSYKAGAFRLHRGLTSGAFPAGQNVDSIQPWMTFDYINRVFKLPPDYLQQSLKIADTHYPNLEITKYAREENLGSLQFLSDVKVAVQNYYAK